MGIHSLLLGPLNERARPIALAQVLSLLRSKTSCRSEGSISPTTNSAVSGAIKLITYGGESEQVSGVFRPRVSTRS